jgi:hypothetical protein
MTVLPRLLGWHVVRRAQEYPAAYDPGRVHGRSAEWSVRRSGGVLLDVRRLVRMAMKPGCGSPLQGFGAQALRYCPALTPSLAAAVI